LLPSPSPPWGRGWPAAGAFVSQGGPGLRPPKGYGHLGRTARYGPQAGEGVPAKLVVVNNNAGQDTRSLRAPQRRRQPNLTPLNIALNSVAARDPPNCEFGFTRLASDGVHSRIGQNHLTLAEYALLFLI
jgi:hypothetical protein